MSLYRAILEEDEVNGVIDTTSDGAPELKEIEDVVANFDANEYEQTEAQDADFGSSDDPAEGEALLDETMIIIGEAQMWDNQIMQAIGIREVNALYEGKNTDMLYEGVDDIKAFFKKIKDWVVSFFKKVWQVMKRYFANLSACVRTNSSFLKKYGSKLDDGAKAYWDGTHKMELKGYPWTKMKSSIDSVSSKENSIIKAIVDAQKETVKQLRSDDSSVAVGAYKDSTADTVAKEVDALRGMTVEENMVESGDYREKLMTYFRGAEEKSDYHMTGKEIRDALDTNTKKAVKKAKENLNKSKTEMKQQITALNNMEKTLQSKENNSKEKDSGRSDKLKAVINYKNLMQGILTMMQVYRSAFLTGCRQYINQARIYGNAYIAAYNKGDKKYKGFQSESAGFLSNVELV